MSTTRTGTGRQPRRQPLAIAVVLALACAAAPLTLAAPAKRTAPEPLQADSRSEIGPQMTLVEGKSTLMRLPYQAQRMSVGDARIADVILLNKNEVYMVGKSAGATNLILWNKNNDATIIDLTVVMDTAVLQARLHELVPNEKNVRISSAADSIIVSGEVSDVAVADQIISIATAFVLRPPRQSQQTGQGQGNAASSSANINSGNVAASNQEAKVTPTPSASTVGAESARVINMLTVAAPQQVMLEVKVAEVSKTLIDQLGASIGGTRTNGSWSYSILTNLLAGVPALGQIAQAGTQNFLQIDAQKRDGLVKVLAEPNIMAISGQEASFLAGGKIFIPVSSNSSNGTTEIKLEEKEFGIAVKFTPTVLEGGRINLRVAPEVSDLNKDGVGISAGGINGTAILPAFTTRRATTTVQLFDGQSFAIGGLIKNNVTTNVKAIPLLGEIPVLGALFRSSDFQTDRTELVFIITPHLVKPLAPGYRLPTDGYIEPSRSQFFLQGKMEGRNARPDPRTQSAPAQAAAPTGFDLK